MKIAIPDTTLAQPLLANIDAVAAEHGWEIVRTTEARTASLLLSNSVDAALVTPLGYGKGVARVDYRIVRGGVVAIQDFTNVVGMWFRENIHTVESCGSSAPDDFLVVIGSIILSEKFETTVTVRKQGEGTADFIVDYVKPGEMPPLDVGEEWYDLTQTLLPVYMWACRIDADIDALEQAVPRFAHVPAEPVIIEEHVPTTGDHFPRTGALHYTWSAEFEDALNEVFEVLFYHQFLTEIPAVKLLGRD